jgi:hypothetical protein
MSDATKTPEPPVEEQELVVGFPPHLTQNYEKAHRELEETYGASPGVAALIRLTSACWTSARIRREFERAILDIQRKTLNPPASGEFDEDCI